MTTTKFLKYISAVMITLSISLFVLTSCSDSSKGNDEEVKESIAQSVTFSESELSNAGGTGKVYYTASAGTPWSAEITSGSDFVSFSLLSTISEISGESKSDVKNILYFYFEQNDFADDRQAVISFAFEGEEPVELTLKQLSTSSSSNPYKSDYSPRWSEIPARVDNDDYLYVSHSTTLNGSEVRNFSLCMDTKNYAAAWVAYPFHSSYDGGVGRNEEWTYDPKIDREYQPNLTKSYGSYGGNSYDRGHQMASADRQATVEMNEQTFYYSNMTPQLGTLNQQKWATLEGSVRDQVCSDTLFVVTGADFTTTIGTAADADGKACPIPGAYYKVLLRTRLGNTGKSVSECSASELQAVGFWMEHRYYSAVPSPVTVKEIEEKTGFIFFPTIPDEVKSTYKSTDWSF